MIDKIMTLTPSPRQTSPRQMLKEVGFQRRNPSGGSSHYTYTLNRMILTIPYKKPYIKEIYIKMAIELLDKFE
ncbi:MAG: toxin HicA [Sedimentibacter sp.]